MIDPKCFRCGALMVDKGKKQVCPQCGAVRHILKAEPGIYGLKSKPEKDK